MRERQSGRGRTSVPTVASPNVVDFEVWALRRVRGGTVVWDREIAQKSLGVTCASRSLMQTKG